MGKSDHPKGAADRDARLKAALKANMGRRKAQARARRQDDTPDAEQAEQKDDAQDG
ncbi:hypothetical protein JANAI62_35670 [Jannaschia pagri]|uniref:Uncharacterized protein n=1 Tax=Jannaschia pagri TaxID=2829797 RepID=A0ABQ4NRS1_9RHOB|nr:hypothetical protein JANAI61_36070 [Jannaschia sp. AI_61]GIT96944.1 hypothetical protein JANAI62_35670 [Jannaschia sp. AI_62]